MKGLLVLEDGTVYRADAIGRPGTSFGELVFNTAMSGYQEVLTDPSYSGQIVVMTAAHIGNYGIRPDEAESDRVHVAGFIARDFPARWSGTGGEESLADYLEHNGVTGLQYVRAGTAVKVKPGVRQRPRQACLRSRIRLSIIRSGARRSDSPGWPESPESDRPLWKPWQAPALHRPGLWGRWGSPRRAAW